MASQRSKSKNFSRAEENVIMLMAAGNELIDAKFSATVTKDTKKKLWQDITDAVNEKGCGGRELKQVKKKWAEMQRLARQKFVIQRAELRQTGNGAVTMVLSENEQEILSKMPQAKLNGFTGGIDMRKPHTVTAGSWDAPTAEPAPSDDLTDETEVTTQPDLTVSAPKNVPSILQKTPAKPQSSTVAANLLTSRLSSAAGVRTNPNAFTIKPPVNTRSPAVPLSQFAPALSIPPTSATIPHPPAKVTIKPSIPQTTPAKPSSTVTATSLTSHISSPALSIPPTSATIPHPPTKVIIKVSRPVKPNTAPNPHNTSAPSPLSARLPTNLPVKAIKTMLPSSSVDVTCSPSTLPPLSISIPEFHSHVLPPAPVTLPDSSVISDVSVPCSTPSNPTTVSTIQPASPATPSTSQTSSSSVSPSSISQTPTGTRINRTQKLSDKPRAIAKRKRTQKKREESDTFHTKVLREQQSFSLSMKETHNLKKESRDEKNKFYSDFLLLKQKENELKAEELQIARERLELERKRLEQDEAKEKRKSAMQMIAQQQLAEAQATRSLLTQLLNKKSS